MYSYQQRVKKSGHAVLPATRADASPGQGEAVHGAALAQLDADGGHLAVQPVPDPDPDVGGGSDRTQAKRRGGVRPERWERVCVGAEPEKQKKIGGKKVNTGTE